MNTRKTVAAVSLLALALYLPLRAIQYDLNGVAEARSLEAGDLFHKNHLLYRPIGYTIYGAARASGYSGNSLSVLQVINALCGAAGAGLCFITFNKVFKNTGAALLGTFWLATSFIYWYFSTDAGYIMLAGLFALAAMAAAAHGRALTSGTFTALSVLTWQASIFLLPFLPGERVWKRRLKIALAAILPAGFVYLIIGLISGPRTPTELAAWVSSYGEAGTLPLWGMWGWDRAGNAALSALRSLVPALLAAGPNDLSGPIQLGRVAVDLAIIALAVLLLLAIVKANRTSLLLLAGYAVFLPFIIWWDPFEPKWFLIPNVFLAGFLTSGLAPWLRGKYSRVFVVAGVFGIAVTNFVTTILPRHTERGPERSMAQCVSEKMDEKDLFVSAHWDWSEYLEYLHERHSASLINESLATVKDRIRETKNKGGSVYMADPRGHSQSHIRWLTNQTGVTLDTLEKLGGSPSFSCQGVALVRL